MLQNVKLVLLLFLSCFCVFFGFNLKFRLENSKNKRKRACNEVRQSRAIMNHDLKSNSSRYTQKTHLITGSPKNDFSWKITEDSRKKNKMFSQKKNSFGQTISVFQSNPIFFKITWFNCSGALTIFGLFDLKKGWSGVWSVDIYNYTCVKCALIIIMTKIHGNEYQWIWIWIFLPLLI